MTATCPFIGVNGSGTVERCIFPEGHDGDHHGWGTEGDDSDHAPSDANTADQPRALRPGHLSDQEVRE